MSKRPRPVTNPTTSRFREGPIRFRNESGGAFARGDLVYLSGFDTTSGLPNALLADADAQGRQAEWVVLGAVANNGIGVAGKVARLTGQNTAGTTTGDPVYLSTTATTTNTLTTSDPTDADPNGLSQVVGFVDDVHASTGTIEIRLPETLDQIGTNEIQDQAVTSAKIADLGIAKGDLAADVVDETKLDLSLPITIALPFTLGNRSGPNSDGVLVGTLTHTAADDVTQEDNSGGTFVDETADAAEATANDVEIPDPFDTNDALYIGADAKFCAVVIDVGTQGVGDAVAGETAWEYWDGDSWETLETGHEFTDDSAALTTGTDTYVVSFVPPADWAATTVDGGPSSFFIRMRATADDVYNTTQPLVTQIWTLQLDTGQGIVVPMAGTISAVDLSALTASATNDDTELLLVNVTQGTFAQLTWSGGDFIDRVTGLSLAVAAGDALVVVCITEDGSTEFASGQLVAQLDF